MVRVYPPLLAHARVRERAPFIALHRRKLFLLSLMTAVALFLPHFCKKSKPPVPKHTSHGKGEKWVRELLASEHPTRMVDALGVTRIVFMLLLHTLQQHCGLRSGRSVGSAEQLAIFLYMVRTGASNSVLQETFARSGSTISK